MPSVFSFCAVQFMEQIRTAHIQRYVWSFAVLAFALALIVRLTRTGTSGAAAIGALSATCLAAGPSNPDNNIFYRSGLPALLMLFVLTAAATRFRRARKTA